MKTPSYLSARVPDDEVQRLAALRELGVLDTATDSRFDDITLLASQICGTPIALVSLVDESRQWFKSRVGLDATETPRDIAFCAHAILESQTFIVPDALEDRRFAGNPLVTGGPKVRFYAGSQLRTSAGHNIGTLCVIDMKPRSLTPEQISAMEALARQVVLNFERQKFATDLHRREGFLKNILGMLPDLVCYIDKDLVYRYVNPAYERWLGIKPEDFIGKKMTDILGKDAIADAMPYILRVLKGERQDFQVHVPYLINGRSIEKFVQVVYVPDIDVQNQVLGYFAVLTDITELKRAEDRALQQAQELAVALQHSKESERSFRSIFDQAPMGIIQLDMNLRIVAANESFCTFLGYSQAELKRMTILDMTHPEDEQRSREAIGRITERSEPLTRFEKRYIRKSGEVVWALVTSRSVKLQDDSEPYVFSVIEDVTQIRAAEQELKAAQAKLVTSAKMASLGEMAGGIAHEINNPLAIIKGKSELLAKRLGQGTLDPAKAGADIAAIGATVDRMSKIVQGLRSFSRSCDQDPLERGALGKVIADAIDLCGERFKNADVSLSINCPTDTLIEARTTQITQILMNLLNNAFDAVQGLPNKWVSVDAKASDASIRISVTDSGPGIDPKLVDRIMEPFFTTKEVGKGTGLGLSISKGIAESHGGTLTYQASGANTGFVLELPLRQPQTQQDQAA
ncbi:MAG: PAS domain S-box protein [Proteobacteria bacterium]|nr:PAS domain S-box protein [Pseudomonadota bacterium]